MLIVPTFDELVFGAPAEEPIVCVFDTLAFVNSGCRRAAKRLFELVLLLLSFAFAASDISPPSTLVIAVVAVPPEVVVPPEMSLLPRAKTSPESEDIFGDPSYLEWPTLLYVPFPAVESTEARRAKRAAIGRWSTDAFSG